MSLLHQSGVQGPNQLGLSWVEFFDDFVGSSIPTVADTGVWLVTTTGTGDAVTLGETGTTGELILFGTAADCVSSAQTNGSCAAFEPGKSMIFECRVKVQNITTDTDQLFGMGEASALPLAATGLPTDADQFVGFRKEGASGDLDLITHTATATATVTLSVGSFVADTYTILRFEWDGISKVRFFQDGVKVGEISTTIPASSVRLVPTVAHQTIDAGAADFNTTIDYVYMAHPR